jgi:dihydrodipicolinate synthase/N-acetylneuraminate lyase
MIASHCVALFRAAAEDPDSKESRKLYEQLKALFYFFKCNGVPQSIKALSAWSDLDLGKPRAPLKELSSPQVSRLRAIVDELARPTEGDLQTSQLSLSMQKRAVS